jgi:deoxyribonuclease V
MTDAELRLFDVTPSEAVELQRRLASRVSQRPLAAPPRTVGGFDLSVRRGAEVARAAAVVVNLETMETEAEAVVELPLRFPYVPGLLSFRETPALLAVYERLSARPDVLMLDGQGLAHPRRFGIACHVGVALGLPALGAAKSPLVGKDARPGPDRGDTAPVTHRGEVVGAAVRTRPRANPIWVSAGHLITLEEAVALVLQLSPRYRIPEPTRRAHILAGRWD